MKNVFVAIPVCALASCAATAPRQDYASEHVISIRYHAYDSTPTLTAEALEMAIEHCGQFGKYANYKGGGSINAFSTEEVHNFACEKTKTDDSAVIAAQSKEPSHTVVTIPVQQPEPQTTTCSTIGLFTNCTSQ